MSARRKTTSDDVPCGCGWVRAAEGDAFHQCEAHRAEVAAIEAAIGASSLYRFEAGVRDALDAEIYERLQRGLRRSDLVAAARPPRGAS